MSAMHTVQDALEKAGFAKPACKGHVAMDAVRRALDAAAPWWQSQGAEPKDGERIVNSPVESETRPTALGAGRRMEAMQRKAGSRPPLGELPDTPKGMAGDEAIAEDALVMDADAANAELAKMQSELDVHDRQYHHGTYQGGPCKLRDKVAKAAKNLGIGGKAVKNLVGPKGGAGSGGAAGAAGGGETEAPEVPDEAEKKFKDDVSAIKAEYQKLRDEAKNAPDRKQREQKLAKMYKKKMQKARMEYLTEALNMSPAEAGACAEIAEKVEEGNPEAKKVVEELAQNPNLSETQKAALEVVNESATEGESKEGEKEEAPAETPTPEAASGETAAPAGEPTDAQFEDELKKLMPDQAQMIDKLSKDFDALNTTLDEEQKKKFWELNEGGDEEAFYQFLGEECGFLPDEVSALRDLTDAYRAAHPDDYPEYAEQRNGTAPTETSGGTTGQTEGGSAPMPTAKATKEEAAAQSPDDPISEGTTPEDHAKVCKANPKSNCPFLKAHMSKEALAALDKPEGAQSAATGETSATSPATGETAAPATGAAQPAAEPSAGAVPPDSSGGETATPAETAEPSAAPAAETEAPAEEPGPLPEPLPEYTPPEGVELDDEEKGALDELRQAYQDSKDPEEQEALKGLYDTMTGELQSRANALLAQQQVENDPAAQAMEQKQPGFMQNMKDFFGGIAKAWKDPKVDVDYLERAQLGLPKDGDIRRSEYLAAKMRAKKKQDAARLAAYEARENAKLDAAEKKSGGGGEGEEDDSDVEEPKVTREYTDGATPTTDIYEPLPPDQTDTTFGEDLQKEFKNELQRLGVNANIVARKDGPSMVEFEVKRDPSLSENDFKKKLKELSQNLGRTFAFESSQSRGNGKAFTGYVRVTNPKPKDAFARRLLEAPGSIEKAQKMAVPFLAGETPDGEAEWVDLGEHGFIGGDSGGGKTFRIRGGLAGMLHVKSPNQLKVMINAHANAGDYADLEGDPHITGIADSVEKVRANLEEANREWKRRSALFKRAKVNNLDAYNKKMVAQGTPEKQLPVQLVITEEVTNLLQEDPSLAKEIKKIVTNGRKFGVCHLGITQDLRAENIPSDIKGAVRMGVKATTSKKAGEMIFGTNSVQPELESLDGKGGIMVQTPEGIKRLRGTYATAKDIAHLVDYNKRTFQKTNANSSSSPAAQPRKLKMPNGIEMETTADGKRKYTYGGKEYVPKMLISNGKKQQVWVRADGSDKTFYTFDNRPAT